MTSLSNGLEPNGTDTSAAGAADAGRGLGNEIGLGNLSASQHATAGQDTPAAPGSAPAVAAAAASVLSYHQANMAAAFRSGQVLANGANEMRRDWAEASASALKDAHDAMAALASVRSVQDLVDVQSRLVRSTMEKALTRGTHVAGATLRLTQQACEPIGARISAATKAFGPPA